MSLVHERFGTSAPLPRLDGKEKLTGSDDAKVKGVMFGGRKKFLSETVGEEGFYAILAKLPPAALSAARTPLASSWYDFEALVQLDRAIYEAMKATHPNVLALMGAASAELGIGRVYKSLDSAKLEDFLDSQTLFHSQFQKFGRVRFEKTDKGARMVYSNYPVYSPIFCASAVGFFMEAILRHGGEQPHVEETTCQTRGQDTCTYELTWK
jgi:predicted hydrocarbon binding protein